MSMRECHREFGFSTAAWHDARRRGVLDTRAPGIPIEELLVAGRARNRGHLRARILKAGLKEERCERCGLDAWRGSPLKVTLHHVNGDPYDNRLENLQFLCPNCHSQTPNFGGRNGHLRPRPDGL
jgi:HNH endonuclease